MRTARPEWTLLALAALGACGDSPIDPGPVTTVTSVVPNAQRVGAPALPEIVVSFSEPVEAADLATIHGAVFGRWSGPMPGAWQLDPGGMNARFSPSRPFAAGEWVTVTLPETVGGGYGWGFWIEAGAGSLDLPSPVVLSARAFGEGRIRSYGAYAGDLNGDGWSDLMIPNEDVNDIRVFLNDGSGSYDSFQSYAVPNGDKPSTNEGADLDGDGDIDVIVGNSRNEVVSVFLNDGLGGMTAAGSHTGGEQIRGLCLADLDLDGVMDIVTANRIGDGDGSVSVFLSDGAGGVRSTATFDAGISGETSCAVGDANRDGRVDVFVGGIGSQEIRILLNDGRGGLELGATVLAGGGPWMLAAGDMDGDGIVDVVSANEAQDNVSILFGDGGGGLTSATTYPVGARPLAVDLGDMDGDGDLDVVTSNFAGVDFTVYENMGDGTLANPRSYAASSAGSCAILHDRDNDGDLDLTAIDELDDLLFLFENGG